MAQERRSNNPLVPDGGQRQPQQSNDLRPNREREKDDSRVAHQRNRESLLEAQRRWENDLYERQNS